MKNAEKKFVLSEEQLEQIVGGEKKDTPTPELKPEDIIPLTTDQK